MATLLAPISWGTTYLTVTELLPDGRPLLVSAMRVLPAGVVLIVASVFGLRWRPRGAEWGRTALLAVFNFGLFFPLLAVAVYRLPGGVAAAGGGLQPLLVAGDLVGGRQAPAATARAGGPVRRRAGGGAGRDPPRRRIGCRRAARRRRRQRVVRDGCRAHQAVPDTGQPAGFDRLAAAARRRCSFR